MSGGHGLTWQQVVGEASRPALRINKCCQRSVTKCRTRKANAGHRLVFMRRQLLEQLQRAKTGNRSAQTMACTSDGVAREDILRVVYLSITWLLQRILTIARSRKELRRTA